MLFKSKSVNSFKTNTFLLPEKILLLNMCIIVESKLVNSFNTDITISKFPEINHILKTILKNTCVLHVLIILIFNLQRNSFSGSKLQFYEKYSIYNANWMHAANLTKSFHSIESSRSTDNTTKQACIKEETVRLPLKWPIFPRCKPSEILKSRLRFFFKVFF